MFRQPNFGTLRFAVKRLLMLLPPIQRYFTRKDAVAADRERLAKELDARTLECDHANEAVSIFRAEHERVHTELLRLMAERRRQDEVDKEIEHLAAELAACTAERHALEKITRELRLAATAFLVQRDEARKRVKPR